jgi:hypothetical protein
MLTTIRLVLINNLYNDSVLFLIHNAHLCYVYWLMNNDSQYIFVTTYHFYSVLCYSNLILDNNLISIYTDQNFNNNNNNTNIQCNNMLLDSFNNNIIHSITYYIDTILYNFNNIFDNSKVNYKYLINILMSKFNYLLIYFYSLLSFYSHIITLLSQLIFFFLNGYNNNDHLILFNNNNLMLFNSNHLMLFNNNHTNFKYRSINHMDPNITIEMEESEEPSSITFDQLPIKVQSIIIYALLTTGDIKFIGPYHYIPERGMFRFVMYCSESKDKNMPSFFKQVNIELKTLLPRFNKVIIEGTENNPQYGYPVSIEKYEYDITNKYWFSTVNYSLFTELIKIWYDLDVIYFDKKMPSYFYLVRYFNEISLAYLIMQNGKWEDNTIYISINDFKEKEVKVLNKVINKKCLIKSTIIKHSSRSFSICILNSDDNLNHLRNYVKEHFLQEYNYKLGIFE